jgi:hypothetical protein
MNERIREVWIKAAREDSDPDNWDTQEQFIKRFAELIVKECYEHCKGEMLDKEVADTHELTYNDGVMDCAVGLLQHFGVEL